jgi:hypothetical protein
VKRSSRSQRLVAVFLLGSLLFDYPLLYLFSKYVTVLDIPILYLYLFTAWAALIGLMALFAERQP